MLVEDLQSDIVEEGVGDPSSVVAVLDFPQLVGPDLSHSDLVSLGVILDGDLGRHSAHGGDLAPAEVELGFVYAKRGRAYL